MIPSNVKSIFAISLDFELHWGVSDRHTVESYGINLKNTRKAIDGMLDLYKKYDIHVTWATVGMLFCKSKSELLSRVPVEKRPAYDVGSFSNYKVAELAGENENEDPYHFAPSVIEKIRSFPNQEIGTHTFSHFYTLEAGQTLDHFRVDIEAAKKIAAEAGVTIRSIVFPRMQYDESYIQECGRLGIQYYRGSQPVLEYAPVSRLKETRKRRMTRFFDSYINYKGKHLYKLEDLKGQSVPVNVPQSLFLRPWSKKLRLFEPLKLRRIKRQMTTAAKTNALYHLWWHPHNFGMHPEKNLKGLERILEHYQYLSAKYGMVSMNMGEAGEYFERSKEDVPNSFIRLPA
jgi:peptidoglycan/xylan/chitin deacetylase (PgdA/CDA1 family)